MENDKDLMRQSLRQIEIGLSIAVVLLGLCAFLLWRILDAVS